MKHETYEKAKQLMNDIHALEEQIDEVNRTQNYITISTPNVPIGDYSCRFQDELFEWACCKRDQYQKEFNELS